MSDDVDSKVLSNIGTLPHH